MRRTAPLLAILIVVSISVFVFFKTFSIHNFPPFANEIMAALLGSVMTVTITAILLRYQTASEVNRDKSVAVFQEKLKMYEGFCAFLSEIAGDGWLQDKEEQALRLWVMKLSLVSGREVSDAVDHFFVQAHRYKTLYYGSLSTAQIENLVAWHREFYGSDRACEDPTQCFMSIGTLVAHLKHDLGEVEISSLQDVASARHAVDDVMRADAAT